MGDSVVITENRERNGFGALMRDAAKRSLDVTAAFSGLAVLMPLLSVIAYKIRKEDGGPVFYRGVRVGRHGRTFKMIKFRTMVVDAEKIGASSTTEDDPRLTGVGRKIRRYKLDELPQLFNVLIGDMSMVGPRPQVQWAVDHYTPEEKEILNVRPGITDFASIEFANEGEILKGSDDPDRLYMEIIHPRKMELCLKYCRQRSLGLDLKLIGRTFCRIVRQTG